MIGLALVLAAQTVVAPPPEEDIVVIGRRVRDWRGNFEASAKGISRECRTKRSTGDPEIDAIGCAVSTDCYAKAHPRIATIFDSVKSRKEAKLQMNALMQAEIVPCMDRAYEPMIAALSERRRIARLGAAK